MLLTNIILGLFTLSSVILIVLVLLHSGQGGGLSDMMGGGLNSAAAGSTVVERNLNRMTVLVGIVFAFCTVALGILWQ